MDTQGGIGDLKKLVVIVSMAKLQYAKIKIVSFLLILKLNSYNKLLKGEYFLKNNIPILFVKYCLPENLQLIKKIKLKML